MLDHGKVVLVVHVVGVVLPLAGTVERFLGMVADLLSYYIVVGFPSRLNVEDSFGSQVVVAAAV